MREETTLTKRDRTIAEVLRRRVLRALQAGTLREGDRLPSARDVAADFGADQRAALAAYRLLVADGVVDMRTRGGVYVSTRAGQAGGVPVPPEEWLVELFAQGMSREIPLTDLSEWLHRAVETLRLRAAVVASTGDQAAGLCRELRDDFGLTASGFTVEQVSDDDQLPLEVRRADLLVTTAAHGKMVERLAERLGKPYVAAAVRPDLIGGEWRLLLKKPVYVVVADPGFVEVLHRFFAGAPGAENLCPLVVGRDDLSAIPDGAPTYVTRGARERLGDTRIRGRILPAARTFSAQSAREIIRFIVRANLEAAAGRNGARVGAAAGRDERRPRDADSVPS